MMSEGGGDLPKMVLRVLLVEADDCTRQIIAALLRKCSHRVAAVADGLKAWEMLKERPHDIDLVLTEVDLPSISGYALLTLIVEHDKCKNIPVIMMSSKDSISTVLKCMVKGASDFLIKPIRKNELRNLWQHVWRRKTQNARSRPQNKVAEDQKIVEVSENDTASNYSRHREASNMCNDERHEECVEMVERSFMPKNKALANMTSSGMGNSSGTAPDSSVAIGSEEGTHCVEPRVMANEVQQGCYSENACTVNEVDYQLNEAVDLMGNFENYLANSDGHCHDSREKSNLASRLDLSLTTFNPSCSNDEASWEEQNLISHSKASAFSNYENAKTLQPLFSELTGCSAPLKEGSSASTWECDATLTESQENETALVMRQPGNCKAAISVSNTQSDSQQVQSQTSSLTYSTSEVQHLEHDKQPFDDNAEEADNRNLVTVEKAVCGSATCGSSDLGSGVTNKHSSSHCGSVSDEATESSFAVASPERAPASETLNYNDVLCHDRTKSESHSTSQREAALIKFRLKRKDRCFDKKVRYESRKRLAEQRPRVKGQFVRQPQNGTQPLKDDMQIVHQ
ncbi:two-component response regulator-like APRR9 isoform X1 [Lycium barbarum]|uniref:two-component response regulator-like APRR9 isoform X1 n=2 Tax=Lycium barbarum TaxID=112863 RepID=UPI00293F5DE1|nr:two-component response regulator-like APRR9 isoform X1 [Lycium barbarum]